MHSIEVDTDECVGKLQWARSTSAVKASLLVRNKVKKKGKGSRERKQLVVIVPAKWKLLKKVEDLRDKADKDAISDLVTNWDFRKLLTYTNPEVNEERQDSEPHATTEIYYPKVAYIHTMAEESLKMISTALEKLTVTQSSSSWARHLKTPDLFKPDTRDNELRQWSDWKFSFENYVKGIDAPMAYSMKLVEENLNGNYELDEMTDETKAQAIRLYSLLISYLRNRPLKLVRHMKQENGFEAWQRLLREMQPVTRARSLALLTQLSRVQFAEGKSISEQLPVYESIVTEYERISGHTYGDDNKVASILQAVPAHLRSHLQLWITDSTTYEQLKNKVMELEALATKWDSSNSLSLPTRMPLDEAVPMEVDNIQKGKKGGKSKSKDGKCSGGSCTGSVAGEQRRWWCQSRTNPPNQGSHRSEAPFLPSALEGLLGLCSHHGRIPTSDPRIKRGPPGLGHTQTEKTWWHLKHVPKLHQDKRKSGDHHVPLRSL